MSVTKEDKELMDKAGELFDNIRDGLRDGFKAGQEDDRMASEILLDAMDDLEARLQYSKADGENCLNLAKAISIVSGAYLEAKTRERAWVVQNIERYKDAKKPQEGSHGTMENCRCTIPSGETRADDPLGEWK